MSFLAPVAGRRLLQQPVLAADCAAYAVRARCFGTTAPLLKKSHRSRKAQKSPVNQAIFVALKPEIGKRALEIQAKRAARKKQAMLDPLEGEVVLTLEDACTKLVEHSQERKKSQMQAVEAYIVTTVDSHETNSFRGRIIYPRDPRRKRERLLIFAEDGSNASDAVKALLKEELASAPAPIAAPEGTDGDQAESQPKYEPSLILGGSEMISEVANKKVSNFTRILCTSTLLPEVSRNFARSWGPKGLMPSVRRGTVVPSDEQEGMLAAIAETRDAADWRSDKVGVVRASIGRLHFEQSDIRKNFTTLLDAVVKKVPVLGTQQATQDGGSGSRYVERPPRDANEMKRVGAMIKAIHLSSTQGPGVKLDLRDALI